MTLFAGPHLQGGLADAFTQAAKAAQNPNNNIVDVTKTLLTDVAKALQPNANPDDTLKSLMNGGLDDKTKLALTAYAKVFEMGLNMAFQGLPGFNNHGPQFVMELAKFLAPADMLKLQQGLDTMKQHSFAGLDTFRAWKY